MLGDEFRFRHLVRKDRRRVRTPAGQRRFGQPIGTVIVPDARALRHQKDSRGKAVVYPIGARHFKNNFDAAFRTPKLAPFRAFVSHYSAKELSGMKTYATNNGKSGLAVKDHGDGRIEATAVFNTSDERGVAARLIREAIERDGVNYLECYGDHLKELYESMGFVQASSDPFNEDYAAPDWNYELHNHPNYYTFTLGKVTKVRKDDIASVIQRIAETEQARIAKMPDGPEKTQAQGQLDAFLALS